MRIVAFVDLDDTLFQTASKCPPGEKIPVAFRRDGSPLSYMVPWQKTLFDWLSASATLIPVTARNLDAFRRVQLPFRSLAVLDFGGVILLPDGSPDAAWDARVRPALLACEAELLRLQRLCQEFSQRQALEVSVRLIRDLDLPLYLVMKHPGGDASRLLPFLEGPLAEVNRQAFFVHHNDNNLSLVPRHLGKEKAVQYLLQTHLAGEPCVTLGLADSFTDAEFLALCNVQMTPRGSQFAEALRKRLEFFGEAGE